MEVHEEAEQKGEGMEARWKGRKKVGKEGMVKENTYSGGKCSGRGRKQNYYRRGGWQGYVIHQSLEHVLVPRS